MATPKDPEADASPTAAADERRPNGKESLDSTPDENSPAEDDKSTDDDGNGNERTSRGQSEESDATSEDDGEIREQDEESAPAPAAEPDAPPLPDEPAPAAEDDGWEYHWNPNTNSWWFYNRFTQVWQQENPRLTANAGAAAPGAGAAATAAATAPGTAAQPALPAGTAPGTAAQPALPTGTAPMSAPGTVANGYNPAIHGSYDPNAWYAQEARAATEAAEAAARAQQQALVEEYSSGAYFNRATGQSQGAEHGPDKYSDEAKSRRQMNAFFDVDAAANMHDGRSLKAERSGKKPSRAELKAFKEKRKAKKEEKRRAWLRD